MSKKATSLYLNNAQTAVNTRLPPPTTNKIYNQSSDWFKKKIKLANVMNNNNKIKIKTPLTMGDARSNDTALIINGKTDNVATDLSAIEWQWNPDEGCFMGECYHYKVEQALIIYGERNNYGELNNTIEWASIKDYKVVIYRANYQIDETGKCSFKIIDIKSVQRAD